MNNLQPDSGTHDTGVPRLLEDSGPPSCEAGALGGVCGCLDLPIHIEAPNLYLLLDRSGSMNEDNKWTVIRDAIAEMMTDLGPRANFAAAVFPAPDNQSDPCATGVEVSPLRKGDSPAGAVGPGNLYLQQATNYPAYGGTPTAATVRTLTPHLAAYRHATFAILATDGGPDCNEALTCPSSQCIVNIEGSAPGCTPNGATDCCSLPDYGPTNCLDGSATVQAIAALRAEGVPTYVMGVPGSAPYADLLNQMAEAGGTARSTLPYYYPVDTTDQGEFYRALSRIAAKVTASCSLPLGQAPPDPALVNVYFNGKAVPASGANGWTLEGMTVTLQGGSCRKVLDGDVLDVRVVAGCPTIEK